MVTIARTERGHDDHAQEIRSYYQQLAACTSFAKSLEAMTQAERQSIYAHIRPPAVSDNRDARQARRRRSKQRLNRHSGPPIRAERIAPIREVLRTYREHDDGKISPITSYLALLEAEVQMLESWAATRSRADQTSGATTRHALELLRTFARITVLDFSDVPDEERAMLVTVLALEHRFCYAAAGTTRASFKVAIGRTGAR